MSHKPLVIHRYKVGYQAWCPICRWESAVFAAVEWARVAANGHVTERDEQ